MAEDFLSRWSKRKSEARTAPAAPAPAAIRGEDPAAAPLAAEAKHAPEPLPPVESLTPESDFTGFMKPDVDDGVRRQALRTLFRDPQFNVMDGLDVYIDDYSKPDPLPESWLSQLRMVERLGAYQEPDPPAEAEIPAPEGAAEAVEAPEKPLHEQGLAATPSDTSEGGDVAPGIV